MATVGEAMGGGMPSTSPLDTMTPPPQMKAIMGGLMKMVGGSEAKGKAPGASSTVGFRTDTTLTGPWDNAALLHGTQLHRGASRRVRRDGTPIGRLRKGEGAAGGDLFAALI